MQFPSSALRRGNASRYLAQSKLACTIRKSCSCDAETQWSGTPADSRAAGTPLSRSGGRETFLREFLGSGSRPDGRHWALCGIPRDSHFFEVHPPLERPHFGLTEKVALIY